MFFSSLVAFFVTTPGSPCSFSVSMWPAVWPVLVHSAPRASHPLNSPTTFLVSYLLGPYSPTFWVWVLHEILLPFAASSTASPVSSFLALVNGSVVVSGAHSNLCSSVAAPAFLVQPLFLNAPTPTAQQTDHKRNRMVRQGAARPIAYARLTDTPALPP